MKLNDFSKGLATRLDPTLIGLDEAVLYSNIDNTANTLKSAKNYTQIGTSLISKWFYLFDGVWYTSDKERDYVEHRSKLYFTQENDLPGKVVNGIEKLLGIEAPTTKLTTLEGANGLLNGVSVTIPTGIGEDISFHPNGNYYTVAHQASPFISTYKKDGNISTKIADPNILPTGNAKGVSYSPDGNYLAVAHEQAPFITVYKINNEFYTEIAIPAIQPTGNGQTVTWSNDSKYLVIAHDVTPYITIYTLTSDVLTKLANPTTLPAGKANSVEFSKSTTYLTVAHDTAPFVTIYKRSGNIFTKLADPVDLPAGNGNGVSWSADSSFLTIVNTSTPFLITYTRSGDVFTKIADPADLPTGDAYAVNYSASSLYLAIAHDITPFVTIYKRTGSIFTKLADPDILPPGQSTGLKFDPNDNYLIVTHTITPFLSTYARSGDTFTKITNAQVLQYTYTYYDSTEGVESAPAPLSDELSIGSGKSVDISGFITSINTAVDTIRLYRIGADTTEFTLIVELPSITLVYNDNVPTLNAIGTLLASNDNQAPLQGLHFLSLANSTLFAALGDKLYFTKLGIFDAWPTLNFIQFDNDITGILPTQDGIFVFSNTGKLKANLLIGTDISNFRVIPLTTDQGCNSNKSCRIIKDTPVWSSDDGICAFTGGTVKVLSKEKLGKVTLDIVNVAIYDEHYYMCLADGSIFAMDFRFGLAFKNFDFTTNEIIDIINVGTFNNKLYAVRNDLEIIDMFTGEELTLKYISPELTEGDASQVKMYNNIYVRANGKFTFKAFIDGTKVSQQDIDGNKIFDIKVPAEKQRGSSIQYDIQGIGTIKEIEYKVLGRQNGR